MATRIIDAREGEDTSPMFATIEVVILDVDPARADKTAEYHLGLGVGKVHIVETPQEAINLVKGFTIPQLVVNGGDVIVGLKESLQALQ